MKTLFLVSYDIMNPQRWHQVYRIMKGYGEHSQYSVFLCRLTPKEKVLMNEALIEAINQNEDRIMIINLGPADGESNNRIEVIGTQEPPKSPAPIVI